MTKQETRKIFREQALEQLSSPEQLDQLLHVVPRRSWVPILTLMAGVALALVWSIIGRIPQSVEGVGILIHPDRVRPFQAPADGQITQLNVHVGMRIEAGQQLGRINQPQLQQQLQQERIHLKEQRDRDQTLLGLMDDRVKSEMESIQKNRDLLKQRIESTTNMALEQKEKNQTYFGSLDENLKHVNQLTKKIADDAQEEFSHIEGLLKQEKATEKEVRDERRASFEADMQYSNTILRTREFELKKLEAEEDYLQRMERVEDLKFQLEQLAVQESKLQQLQAEAKAQSDIRITEIEQDIARYETELDTKSKINSDFTGKVLELSAAVGQFVREGEPLGAIEIENEEGALLAIAYFELRDGKKIEKDMTAQVAPSTVQRERYGSIIGSVHEVSEYAYSTAAATNVVGSAEVARRLTEGGNKIQVKTTLAPDADAPTGFRWTSGKGPDTVDISAGTPVTVRVIIGDRRPISYVIPLMRRWSGS